jgi:hypothetical protein
LASPSVGGSLRYTPDTYSDLGRGIGVALLDMFSLNPSSRIPHTPFVSLSGVRTALERQLRSLHLDQERCSNIIAGQVHRTKLDRNKALEKSSVAYCLPVMNAYDNVSKHKLRHPRDEEPSAGDEPAAQVMPFRLQV